jgi:outer membrane protein assembly factor BamB
MLRLVLAALITLVVLPYAWGRILVIRLLTGRSEALYLGLLVVAVLAVILLTRGRAAAVGTLPGRRIGYALAAAWVTTNVVLIALLSGPLIPWPLVALAFLPATLLPIWVAWMFYGALSWRTRLAGVALGIVGLAVSGLLLRVEGLTGGSEANFTWRWDRPKEFVATGPATVGSADAPDFTRIGPNDYAQFLGPQRLGVLPAARLNRDWTSRPPRRLWRKDVGAGWGAFAVAGGYAVTQEQRGADECVVCYRIADGTQVWVHSDPVRFETSLGGPGPRATPTLADGHVYTVGATGLLNCLDGATGRVVWSTNLLEDNAAENLAHGVSGSPLLLGNQVLVCPTGKNGICLAAYDPTSGKLQWQATQSQASYGSPLVATLGGVAQVLLHTADGVSAFDPQGGAVLWSFPWTNVEQVNCSQPIPNAGGPDQVFVATGYGKGSALVRVERDGDGWRVTPLWEGRHMKTKFTTAVVHSGYVYGLDDGILECVDLKTGERAWKDGRYRHGQVLLVGDLLVVQAENGDVALVEANPRGLRELGRIAALEGKTWNPPALAGRYLLVRNDHEAACYEVAE